MFAPPVAKPKSGGREQPAAAPRAGAAVAQTQHPKSHTAPGGTSDFSAIPPFGFGAEASPTATALRFPIQANLERRALDEPLEREADRFADEVARAAESDGGDDV